MTWLLLLCIIIYITNGSFERYSGGNCAYVYDATLEEFFPLNKCIPYYDAVDGDHSREYSVIDDDGTEKVQRLTYYTQNCTGEIEVTTPNVLDLTNPIYNNPEQSVSEDCYLEYIEYKDCSNWNTSTSVDFETKYIIVGACISINNDNQYSRCSTADTEISYVRFNDDTCCDLSYVDTGNDGPIWQSYDSIIPGCNEAKNTYIDIDSWNCEIPTDADNTNVFSDNTDPDCKDNSSYISIFVSSISILCLLLLIF